MPTEAGGGLPVQLPRSATWSLPCGAHQYDLMVAWPAGAPPVDGFPVHYLLDADLFFGALVDGVRARERRTDATGVEPAIVVGLALRAPPDLRRAQRHFDFTPTTAPADLPPTDLGTPWPPHGGAEAFGAWLTDTVLPFVAARYPVAEHRTTLLAHSLAGLCAVDLLTRAPAAFASWQIASPSLWWYQDRLATVAARVPPVPPVTAVTLAVGAYEDHLAPWQVGHPDAPRIAERRAQRSMGDRTAALADALRVALPGSTIRLQRYAGEDHASVMFRLLLDALRPVASAPSRPSAQ